MPFVKRVRDYYKYGTEIDANVVGSFGRITDGVASGFSNTNYLEIANSFDVSGGKTWEMVYKVTTGSSVSGIQSICGHTGSTNYDPVLVNVTDGKFVVSFASGSSSFIVDDTYGKYQIKPNTTCWVKITFDGSAYILSYSLDGVDFIEDIRVSSTKSIYTSNLVIGRQQGNQSEYPWLGSVHLNESHVKINNDLIWSGDKYTTVGGWIDEGVVSGFSASQYLTINTPNFRDAYAWEICLKANASVYDKYIFQSSVNSSDSGRFGVSIYLSSNKTYKFDLSFNGSSWFSSSSLVNYNIPIELNKDYYIKMSFNGSIYKLEVSEDNITWQTTAEYTSTEKVYTLAYTRIGSYNNTSYYWNGSIDLNQSYIKINDKLWWHGTKAVETTVDDYDYFVERNKLYQLVEPKRTYYKYGNEIDVNKTGSWGKITDGVAGGFTTSNYLEVPNKFSLNTSDSFEIVTSFVHKKQSSSSYILGASADAILSISTTNNNVIKAAAGNGSSWYGDLVGKTTLSEGVKYWVKLLRDVSGWYLSLSTDGVSYELEVSNTWSTVPASTNILIGYVKANSSFIGYSIDLNETYIKINNELWWDGNTYNKIGSWMENGVMGTFSRSNYTSLPFTFTGSSYNNWELVTKINLNSYTNAPAILCVNSSYGIFNYSIQSSGRQQLALSTNTDTFNICDALGEKILDLNTWYWLKAEFTGEEYNTYWSIDGKIWNLDSSVKKTTKLGTISVLNFGIRTKNSDQTLDGLIDMKQCYLKTNGEEVWRGTNVSEINVSNKDIYTVWTQPVLSSDGLMEVDNFAVYCSNAGSPYPIYKAFDGSVSSFTDIAFPDSNIIIYNRNPLNVTNIKVVNRNEFGLSVTGYTIYGSNTNGDWEEILSGINDITSASAVWNIDLSENTRSFKYYKISVTSAVLGGTNFQIGEITLTATQLMPTSNDYDYYVNHNKLYQLVANKRTYWKRVPFEYSLPKMTSNTAPEGKVTYDIVIGGPYASNIYPIFWGGSGININGLYNQATRYLRYTFAKILKAGKYTFTYVAYKQNSVTNNLNKWEAILEDDSRVEIMNPTITTSSQTFTAEFEVDKPIKAINLTLYASAPSEASCYYLIDKIALTGEGLAENTVVALNDVVTNKSDYDYYIDKLLSY